MKINPIQSNIAFKSKVFIIDDKNRANQIDNLIGLFSFNNADAIANKDAFIRGIEELEQNGNDDVVFLTTSQYGTDNRINMRVCWNNPDGDRIIGKSARSIPLSKGEVNLAKMYRTAQYESDSVQHKADFDKYRIS